jgi:hypothetical protein
VNGRRAPGAVWIAAVLLCALALASSGLILLGGRAMYALSVRPDKSFVDDYVVAGLPYAAPMLAAPFVAFGLIRGWRTAFVVAMAACVFTVVWLWPFVVDREAGNGYTVTLSAFAVLVAGCLAISWRFFWARAVATDPAGSLAGPREPT